MILRRFYKAFNGETTKYLNLSSLEGVWQRDGVKTIDGVDHIALSVEGSVSGHDHLIPADQLSAFFHDMESKLNDLDNFRRTGIWPKLK